MKILTEITKLPYIQIRQLPLTPILTVYDDVQLNSPDGAYNDRERLRRLRRQIEAKLQTRDQNCGQEFADQSAGLPYLSGPTLREILLSLAPLFTIRER